MCDVDNFMIVRDNKLMGVLYLWSRIGESMVDLPSRTKHRYTSSSWTQCRRIFAQYNRIPLL
ncbi:hypothetical protein PsorP6_000727 [Peronosclerospora sorghi]|uniref:Uncharacterized protein n=1 Tax=Peronosclerospora sorghi TaxID=230839 RepID=A0ACC0WZ79_9STRA|nr:hypothetical protein PsorP6_000727 [Peronosclerospora sorghi]